MQKRSLADQNDEFRRGHSSIPGKVTVTASISTLPKKEIRTILKKVQEFD